MTRNTGIYSLPLGILMHGLMELLDYLDDHSHVLLSCVRAPLDVGIFYVFCTLFRRPNVGQGYYDITLSIIVILCAPNLPSDLVPL